MGSPKAPAPPDPYETGAAQTATNIGTAIANQVGGWADQSDPYGTITRTQTGTYTYVDPNSGKSHEIPTWAIQQSFTPEGQAIHDATMATQQNLANVARDQSGRIGGLLGAPMDTSGVVDRKAVPGLQQMGWAGPASGKIDATPAIQRLGPQMNLTGAVDRVGQGPRNYAIADRGRVEEAIMSRLSPQLERDRASLENSLAQKGIMPGSAAFDREMARMDQASTDARMQAILAGGQEQSRLTGLNRDRALFQSGAQGQAFDQAVQRRNLVNAAQQQNIENRMGLAAFNNQAQQQQFGQNVIAREMQNAANDQTFRNQMAAKGFNNATQMDAWRAQEAARAASLQEAYQQRNQPINEISALLGGSQVQMPGFVNNPALNAPTTDYAGLINTNYNQRLNQWQQNQAAQGSMMSGIGRLAGLFMGF